MNALGFAVIAVLLGVIAYRLERIQEFLRVIVARSEPDDY